MTPRSVEVVIGRLLTDDEFRDRFRRAPVATLKGLDLTTTEVSALVSMDLTLWPQVARWMEPRLRKDASAA